MSIIEDITTIEKLLKKIKSEVDNIQRIQKRSDSLFKVKSSNIAAAGYDSFFSVLTIEFVNGAIYRYYHVPAYIYTEFLDAPSKGRYFSQCIKDKFTYDKIREKS